MEQTDLFRLSALVAAKLGQEDTPHFQPSTDPIQALELLAKVSGSVTITRTAAKSLGQFGVNVMRKMENQWVWAGRGDGDTLPIAICKMYLSIRA